MTAPLWIAAALTSGCADAPDTPAGDSEDTGALALPRGGRSLYVSNSANEQPQGSGANLARFSFDATGPLNPMGTAPACGGARGLVLTPDLRFAYLACSSDNQIAMYSVAADGALTRIGQIDFSGPFGIAIAPNGRTLYVDNVGANTLASFHVESDGRLALLNSVDAGGSPPAKGVAVTPDGNFVYVAHGDPKTTTENVVTGFAINADGSLRSNKVAEATNGAGGAEEAITPDGRFLYIAAGGSDRVFGYRINADGSLAAVPGGSFPTGVGPEGLAISPDGRWIFNAAPRPGLMVQVTGSVTGWAIGADGALTEVEGFMADEGGRPIGIRFTPDGRHLYITNYSQDKVLAYSISRRGSLRKIQTVDSAGPEPGFQALAILPNLGPVASFSVHPGAAHRPTRFDASASRDPDGQIASYDWDFGDGTYQRTAGPIVHHVYRAAGRHQVRLTVIDNEGCSTSLVFTGQVASCVGSDAAAAAKMVVVH
jgi:6-phosphogluconolactonase (cycloisomerase 2 family)